MLMQEEMKKYDALKKGIAENLAMQAQLLGVIGSQQGVYKSVFGITEWRQTCEGAAAGLRAQVKGYKEARDNLSEGLRFYMSLQEAIVQLSQQIGDFCLTRRIQRCHFPNSSSRLPNPPPSPNPPSLLYIGSSCPELTFYSSSSIY